MRKRKPLVMLPPKVYIRETGETVDMTPELQKIVSKRCADALIRFASESVLREMGFK